MQVLVLSIVEGRLLNKLALMISLRGVVDVTLNSGNMLLGVSSSVLDGLVRVSTVRTLRVSVLEFVCLNCLGLNSSVVGIVGVTNGLPVLNGVLRVTCFLIAIA